MRCLIGVWAGWMLAASAVGAAAADFKTLRNLTPPPAATPQPLHPDAKVSPVRFAKIVFHPREGEAWAIVYQSIPIRAEGDRTPAYEFVSWNGGRLAAQSDGFARAFAEELGKAGFKADRQESLFGSDTAAADLQVGVLVEDIKGRFCGDCPNLFQKTKLSAVVNMKTRWEIYSNVQRAVIGTVITEGGAMQSKALQGSIEPAIYDAFRENVRHLLASEDFRRIVLDAANATPGVIANGAGLTPISLNTGAQPPKRTISDASGSVVAVFAGEGHGSGFLVSDDGYLITNQHVVGGSKYVKVRWSDGFETVGEVIRSDKRRDVALVKTDPHGRSALALRRGGLQPGEAVFALGTPLDPKFQGTVTKGVMSSTRIIDGFSYIQSDVTVNPGNSGGPLLDEKGAVVGITVWGFQPDGVPTGINLFIPIGDALDFLNLKPAA